MKYANGCKNYILILIFKRILIVFNLMYGTNLSYFLSGPLQKILVDKNKILKMLSCSECTERIKYY